MGCYCGPGTSAQRTSSLRSLDQHVLEPRLHGHLRHQPGRQPAPHGLGRHRLWPVAVRRADSQRVHHEQRNLTCHRHDGRKAGLHHLGRCLPAEYSDQARTDHFHERTGVWPRARRPSRALPGASTAQAQRRSRRGHRCHRSAIRLGALASSRRNDSVDEHDQMIDTTVTTDVAVIRAVVREVDRKSAVGTGVVRTHQMT